MKLIVSALFLLVSVEVASQDFKTPMEYLEFIGKESDNISKMTWKYTTSVAHSKSARKIDNTRKALVKTIQTAHKKISGIKNGYKGDTEYHNQMLAYLDISEKHINQEYEKIIDLQEVAEQSYDFMEAYILARDLVNEKINAEVDQLNVNQKAFGNKYGISITEDKSALAKKMKISNEVFSNQTDLYLIFFKCNITEYNLMDAVAKKDLGAIEQNSNALKGFAAEGLEKLTTYLPYKNDLMLVNATKKALEFYQKEATELAPRVTAFMMLNQQLEDTKLVIEAKPQKDRTKADIDSYNKLVNDINKEIGVYNKTMAKFNTEKTNAINNWNTASTNFITKHVPKE